MMPTISVPNPDPANLELNSVSFQSPRNKVTLGSKAILCHTFFLMEGRNVIRFLLLLQ